MKTIAKLFYTLVACLSSMVMAEIVPVWSVDVAIPGEKVALYLVDTEIGEDLFRIPQRPMVKNAAMEMMQHYAGANPMDPIRSRLRPMPRARSAFQSWWSSIIPGARKPSPFPRCRLFPRAISAG